MVEYFKMRVSNNDMAAERILSGDVLIVRSADTAEDGQMVVLLGDDNNALVKRYCAEEDKEKVFIGIVEKSEISFAE